MQELSWHPPITELVQYPISQLDLKLIGLYYFCFIYRAAFDCLSSCTNPKFLLVLLCVASFLQGFIVNGLINVNISTLERR